MKGGCAEWLPAKFGAQLGPDAPLDFVSGFFGEREGQNPARRKPLSPDQLHDTAHQRGGLAGTRAGNDHQRRQRMVNSRLLLGVELEGAVGCRHLQPGYINNTRPARAALVVHTKLTILLSSQLQPL